MHPSVLATPASALAADNVAPSSPTRSLFPAFSVDILMKQLSPAVYASRESAQAQNNASKAMFEQIETFHKFPNSAVPLLRYSPRPRFKLKERLRGIDC